MSYFIFLLTLRLTLTTTLFPYTTLFRSLEDSKELRLQQRAHLDDLVQEQRAARSLLEMSRSEEHTSELQSLRHLVCRLLLEKKNYIKDSVNDIHIYTVICTGYFNYVAYH